jgi:hypothetical protein
MRGWLVSVWAGTRRGAKMGRLAHVLSGPRREIDRRQLKFPDRSVAASEGQQYRQLL